MSTQDAPRRPDVVRLSVNLSPDVADALRSLTAEQGINATEGIRRAISVWKLWCDVQRRGGIVETVTPRLYRKPKREAWSLNHGEGK